RRDAAAILRPTAPPVRIRGERLAKERLRCHGLDASVEWWARRQRCSLRCGGLGGRTQPLLLPRPDRPARALGPSTSHGAARIMIELRNKHTLTGKLCCFQIVLCAQLGGDFLSQSLTSKGLCRPHSFPSDAICKRRPVGYAGLWFRGNFAFGWFTDLPDYLFGGPRSARSAASRSASTFSAASRFACAEASIFATLAASRFASLAASRSTLRAASRSAFSAAPRCGRSAASTFACYAASRFACLAASRSAFRAASRSAFSAALRFARSMASSLPFSAASRFACCAASRRAFSAAASLARSAAASRPV